MCNSKGLGTKILIKISEDHFITGKLEIIENDVTPIIKQLNSNGLPLDIGVVQKIRNQYLDVESDTFTLVGE